LGIIHSEEAFEESKRKALASPSEIVQALDMKNEGAKAAGEPKQKFKLGQSND